MTQRLTIKVHGHPAPQGSKRHVGRGRLIESSKRLAPWRHAVEIAARTAIDLHPHFEPFDGPVRVRVTFWFQRPKAHYRSGRYSHLLRPQAPTHHTVYPDADKIQRSTFDALTRAGAWSDDARVAIVHAEKLWATNPGAHIEISEVLP